MTRFIVGVYLFYMKSGHYLFRVDKQDSVIP